MQDTLILQSLCRRKEANLIRDMTEQNDLLGEIKLPSEKNRLYIVLLYSCAIYMLLVILGFFIDLEPISADYKSGDLMLLAVLLLPAAGGLLACLGRSQIGWFINILYYTAIASFLVPAFLEALFNESGRIDLISESYLAITFCLLPISIIILLFLKSVWRYLRVSTLSLSVGVIVSLMFGIVLAFGSAHIFSPN